MTANQIAWINAQENRRSNLERESETHRSNTANELQKRNELAETVRANKERELENIRHNRVSENISLGSLNETIRANQVREHETFRHNLMDESMKQTALRETFRHNVMEEGLKQSADRAKIAVDLVKHRENYNISQGSLAEERRHNKANEDIAIAKSVISLLDLF